MLDLLFIRLIIISICYASGVSWFVGISKSDQQQFFFPSSDAAAIIILINADDIANTFFGTEGLVEGLARSHDLLWDDLTSIEQIYLSFDVRIAKECCYHPSIDIITKSCSESREETHRCRFSYFVDHSKLFLILHLGIDSLVDLMYFPCLCKQYMSFQLYC